jgi:hypothetical protein
MILAAFVGVSPQCFPALLLPLSTFLFDDFLLSGTWRITCGPALPLPSSKTASTTALNHIGCNPSSKTLKSEQNA